MKRYEIRCTPEQSKKAFELGAPIKANKDYSNGNVSGTLCVYGDITNKNSYGIGECTILHIPTAEQMVCWLEEQGLIVTTDIGFTTEWYSYVKRNRELLFLEHRFSTRKEATLVAIDAALDYLRNNK